MAPMKGRHMRSWMKTLALAAGIAALATAATTSGASADVIDDIRKRGKLIVGVKADYAPYGYLSSDGKVVGLEPDLAQDGSEEHTSELQSLMRISYAVFCLKKKTITTKHNITTTRRQKHNT